MFIYHLLAVPALLVLCRLVELIIWVVLIVLIILWHSITPLFNNYSIDCAKIQCFAEKLWKYGVMHKQEQEFLYDLTLLKIGSFVVPKITILSLTLSDLDSENTGNSESGYMFRDVVRKDVASLALT